MSDEKWPYVSVVITTYLENTKPYLDLCVKSVMNLDYPKDKLEIIITSPLWNRPEYPGVKNVSPPKDCAFAANANYGMSQTSKESNHLLLLTDDTMITKNSLKNMVQISETLNGEKIINATSNCDNFWQYILNFSFMFGDQKVIVEKRYYQLEELAPLSDHMINAASMYPVGVIIPEQICLYGTLFPRKIWESVGGFDEGYNQGWEDTDFCRQAKVNGFGLCIALNAIIWHFGGVTSNQIVNEEMREKNLKRFVDKWGGK